LSVERAPPHSCATTAEPEPPVPWPVPPYSQDRRGSGRRHERAHDRGKACARSDGDRSGAAEAVVPAAAPEGDQRHRARGRAEDEQRIFRMRGARRWRRASPALRAVLSRPELEAAPGTALASAECARLAQQRALGKAVRCKRRDDQAQLCGRLRSRRRRDPQPQTPGHQDRTPPAPK